MITFIGRIPPVTTCVLVEIVPIRVCLSTTVNTVPT